MAAHAEYGERWWPLLETACPRSTDEVLVVAVALDGMNDDDATLDQRERERAARLRDPLLRQRHVAAHSALRQLLGWRLGSEPGALAIMVDHHGKPTLRDHPLVFNLSHSGGWALIALAPDGLIGIDLELGERLGEVDRLAERLFDTTDLAAFRALPQAMQARAFLTAWTRKEAALKALGLGLPGGMEHVQVAEHPLRLRGDHTRLPGLASLHLHDLPAIGGGAAALCQGPRRRAVVCRRWPTSATVISARPLPNGLLS
jgi:4'-phosphopantetheinyl transferase